MIGFLRQRLLLPLVLRLLGACAPDSSSPACLSPSGMRRAGQGAKFGLSPVVLVNGRLTRSQPAVKQARPPSEAAVPRTFRSRPHDRPRGSAWRTVARGRILRTRCSPSLRGGGRGRHSADRALRARPSWPTAARVCRERALSGLKPSRRLSSSGAAAPPSAHPPQRAVGRRGPPGHPPAGLRRGPPASIAANELSRAPARACWPGPPPADGPPQRPRGLARSTPRPPASVAATRTSTSGPRSSPARLLATHPAGCSAGTSHRTGLGTRLHGDPRTVDVHVRWLRSKIETDPERRPTSSPSAARLPARPRVL